MTPGELRMVLYARDVQLTVTDGRLHYKAPEGALNRALAAEIREHKLQLVAILEAEAEYNRLSEEVFEKANLAEWRRRCGDEYGAAELSAEVRALVAGRYWDASQRLLELLGDGWCRALDAEMLSQAEHHRAVDRPERPAGDQGDSATPAGSVWPATARPLRSGRGPPRT